jgi:hypothetical protein
MRMHISSPKAPHARVMQCIIKSNICFNLADCEQDQKENVHYREIGLITIGMKFFGRV